MAIGWTDPKPAGPRIDGRVFFAVKGKGVIFVPLGPPVACWMHYTPAGSRPHEDEGCPYCPSQMDKKAWVPSVTFAWTPAENRHTWRRGAFELTHNCLHDWSDDLIGCAVCAKRVGEQRNGKVSIELNEDQTVIPAELCAAFDVMPILLRAWGMINRNGHLMRRPSDVLPLNKPGKRLA